MLRRTHLFCTTQNVVDRPSVKYLKHSPTTARKERETTTSATRCRPNGTYHDWPAVVCCPWWVTLRRRGLECYRRRQTPATVTSLAPYNMCRRASNNYKRGLHSCTWHYISQAG